jgi:clathrin light chain A
MSDPFEAFEAALGGNEISNIEADPAAEFLAREQAELAKIESDSINFDSFGDFGGASTEAEPKAETETIKFNDPFGGSESNTENLTSVEQTDTVKTIVQETNIEEEESDNFSAIAQAVRLDQEPEKMKLWREEQRQRLQTKDETEAIKQKEWKEASKRELEEWYKKRQEQLTKTHSNNKSNNTASEAEMTKSNNEFECGQEWERMAKLCDFNPKANKNNRDVSRLRSILLNLKQQPLVRPSAN